MPSLVIKISKIKSKNLQKLASDWPFPLVCTIPSMRFWLSWGAASFSTTPYGTGLVLAACCAGYMLLYSSDNLFDWIAFSFHDLRRPMCLIHAPNSHSAWHCFQGAPQRTIELSIGNTKVTMRAIDPTWKDLLNTLVTKQKNLLK